MRELSLGEMEAIAGGKIDQGNELAAGAIMTVGAGMVGGLLGAAGGPIGMAMGASAGARLGFKFVEYITQ